MKTDENVKIINEIEEHTTKELKNKREINNVWFENNEENKNTKKTHGHSGKEKNVIVERND